MLKITFLGTSGATPTKSRSLPSVSIEREGSVYLFDCGEGTQMQMMKYGISPQKVKAIFISHLHGDHVIGLAGLLRSMALNARKDEISIFIPKGYESGVKALISFDKAMFGYRIRVISIPHRVSKLLDERDFTISSFPLKHTLPSSGFAFREKDRRRFVKSKYEKYNIKGTDFSKISKSGKLKTNGRTITLQDVTEVAKGRAVVYASDTRPSKSTVKASLNADLLIHESSYMSSEKNLAQERMHSTAAEAAEIAKEAHAERLVLTHISARYKDARPMEREAREIFQKAKVANDGDVISL
jgi:ribonuclease Z